MDSQQTKDSKYTPQVNLVPTSAVSVNSCLSSYITTKLQVIVCENYMLEKESFENTITHELVSTVPIGFPNVATVLSVMCLH